MAITKNTQGSLTAYKSYDLAPHIGTRFPEPNVQLSSFLSSPESDELIKDLAHLISLRGVVFFSGQDLTVTQQKELMVKLGEASGRPEDSGLHRRMIQELAPEYEDEVTIISPLPRDDGENAGVKDLIKMPYAVDVAGNETRRAPGAPRLASKGWHSDVSFETIPPDYTILKMLTVPETGGDTMWASTYEAYDRLSAPYKRFLEGLTAVHSGQFVAKFAHERGLTLQDNRGSQLNSGEDLAAVHPVVRTNPVTGYKALFINRAFTKRILELDEEESWHQLEYLFRHIAENHDLQVRHRWQANDVALFDNRCTVHTATYDYGESKRMGLRVVGIGERPYLDVNAKSMREDLAGGVRVAASA